MLLPALSLPAQTLLWSAWLLQAGLAWWSVISPFSGLGSTAALVFVLAVAAVKAIWEDVKRHQEDNRMNTSITHRVNADGALWVAAAAPAGCSCCRTVQLTRCPLLSVAPPSQQISPANPAALPVYPLCLSAPCRQHQRHLLDGGGGGQRDCGV